MSQHYDILRSIRQNNRIYQNAPVMQLAPIQTAQPVQKVSSYPVFENQCIVPLDAENQLTIKMPRWYQFWAKSRFFLHKQELKPEKLKFFATSRKVRLTQLASGQKVFMKHSQWGDPLPDIYLDEQRVQHKEPQNWIEKAFIFFPFAIVPACRGGLVPALVGMLAISINYKLSRLPYTRVQRLWLIALVNITAFVTGYLLVGSLFALLLLFGLNPFPQ
jgi:hypothetical protein